MAKRPKNIRNLKRIGKTGNELNKQIELSCGFGELRKNLDVFGEMKEWGAKEEIGRQGEVGNQLPTIQEENGEKWKWSSRRLRKMVAVEIIDGFHRGQITKIMRTLNQDGAK